MDKYDSQQAVGAEPAEGAKQAGGSPRADEQGAAAGWEGYSPDTLAALLDGQSPAVW
jgi:hypothetical protein